MSFIYVRCNTPERERIYEDAEKRAKEMGISLTAYVLSLLTKDTKEPKKKTVSK